MSVVVAVIVAAVAVMIVMVMGLRSSQSRVYRHGLL